jgi:3-phenylpropionate/trans-cinnamate dioxygenase ferredoxin reductase subunit
LPVSEGVVIVGGGLAAARCAETLRRIGYERRVRMLCAEPHLPYDRPPLSKELLDPAGEPETPSFRAGDWYSERAIEVLSATPAVALDLAARRVTTAGGESIGYDELVIATGSRPRTLPLFNGFENVSTLRTLEDAERIRGLFAERRRLAIIGAGFIGQEVAAAARGAGAEVTVVELADAPLIGTLGAEIAGWFTAIHRAAGVELRLGSQVAELAGERRITSLTLDDGSTVPCDHVLVAVGVAPDCGWLESAGFSAAGVETDELGRTEHPGVYAVGDVAAVYDRFLERHVLAGHWESAARGGVQVATTIVGHDPAPTPLSSFWSDQYGMRIQYLGHAELADSVSVDGDPQARDFVAHYTRGGELVGALIVGRPRAVGEIRERLRYMTERTPA